MNVARLLVVHNVAGTGVGATCTASSEFDAMWGCEKALNGR